jgi:hypothetical protein
MQSFRGGFRLLPSLIDVRRGIMTGLIRLQRMLATSGKLSNGQAFNTRKPGGLETAVLSGVNLKIHFILR